MTLYGIITEKYFNCSPFIHRISENIKIASAAYRDQMKSPLETAVYWIEYLARHDGAPQLQSHAKQLHFIQYHNLDVIAVLAFFFIVLPLVLLIKLCKLICKSFKSPKSCTRKSKGD